MKEIKDKQLKFRVSTKEKEIIEKYAKEHEITVSELLRVALNRFMALEKEKGEN